MKIIPLQSGSNGNCIYVETADARLLFDAGISGKQAEERLRAAGRDIRDVDALLISHDHGDHARSLGIFQRKFGLAAHVSNGTLVAAARRHRLGKLGVIHRFEPGARLRVGGTAIETVPTPHDGSDGVAFVIDDGRRRFGLLTDLGHDFTGLDDLIGSLDGLLIESNYDPDMLSRGPYPASLKRRIRSDRGHLSNDEAAELVRRSANRRLQWCCLGHLSGENNSPDVALATARRALGADFPLALAHRDGASAELELA